MPHSYPSSTTIPSFLERRLFISQISSINVAGWSTRKVSCQLTVSFLPQPSLDPKETLITITNAICCPSRSVFFASEEIYYFLRFLVISIRDVANRERKHIYLYLYRYIEQREKKQIIDIVHLQLKRFRYHDKQIQITAFIWYCAVASHPQAECFDMLYLR